MAGKNNDSESQESQFNWLVIYYWKQIGKVICQWGAKLVKMHPFQDLDWKFRCLLYTSPSPRDRTRSRMPSSA